MAGEAIRRHLNKKEQKGSARSYPLFHSPYYYYFYFLFLKYKYNSSIGMWITFSPTPKKIAMSKD
jgi:hypothetical protein